ncbi:hypothetical protein H6F90_03690 [Trichocoleus sp. FACHB-591]|uniref:hypothetical protein n=1 Tax=Trichocoleus sp. FACHB-591 TaxID=2692872 RepID=UPI001682B497|nr:hypothetical protein [Trichocoleus sp. FACHB-591]MBD2094249.1 hypothetical protein [Trichocoleus sp. FACHB-591]
MALRGHRQRSRRGAHSRTHEQVGADACHCHQRGHDQQHRPGILTGEPVIPALPDIDIDVDFAWLLLRHQALGL